MRQPTKKETVYLVVILLMIGLACLYVATADLSFKALFAYGLLQPKNVSPEETRLVEIDTPLSRNLIKVGWYILLKSSAVLSELIQFWLVGMIIAAALIVFVPWEKIKRKMAYGTLASVMLATIAGAIIPICSCGVVPILAGMVQAGVPLGPTMSFLVAAPMLNIAAIFMTGGVLGWQLALGRTLGTFFIAISVGTVLSAWQKKKRFLRRFLKLSLTPNLPPDLQRLAFKVAMALTKAKKLPTEKLVKPEEEEKLFLLGEAGILDRDEAGLWFLPEVSKAEADVAGACYVLPQGDQILSWREKFGKLFTTSWDLFLQLNYYLILAVFIAGAIKVVLPTKLIVQFVGGESLNSVLFSSVVSVLAYVCTYVEIPTALALMAKGMGGGATLAYLLGGPGLSLPSIAMLAGVFKPRVLALYVALSFIGCVLAGYLFNLFL